MYNIKTQQSPSLNTSLNTFLSNPIREHNKSSATICNDLSWNNFLVSNAKYKCLNKYIQQCYSKKNKASTTVCRVLRWSILYMCVCALLWESVGSICNVFVFRLFIENVFHSLPHCSVASNTSVIIICTYCYYVRLRFYFY